MEPALGCRLPGLSVISSYEHIASALTSASKAAHQIYDETDQQNQAKTPATNGRAAEVKTTAAEQKNQDDQQDKQIHAYARYHVKPPSLWGIHLPKCFVPFDLNAPEEWPLRGRTHGVHLGPLPLGVLAAFTPPCEATR